MSDAQPHLARARASLEFARFALSAGFTEEAGRGAYMAAFHAAMAFIAHRTGKTPKTHRGVRSEFARLAKAEGCFTQPQVGLLGWSYELKTAADYGGSAEEVDVSDVERAISEASGLLGLVEELTRSV